MSRLVRCLTLACGILAAASTNLAAQAGTVTGQVTDGRTRAPISAAQVAIRALSVGSLTQANGRFLIPNVAAGTHTVEVSRIGFTAVTQQVVVRAGEAVAINVELTEEAIGLDEIVVTGTAGATQKRALGQSVARLDAAEAIAAAPVMDVQNMLQGRIAGAFVRQSSGVIGQGPEIAIRGVKSLTLGSNPLVFVDGIRVANGAARLEDLNLGEVESIEVVKGPAAATLYGTEAAAGVIQIITKRGQEGAPRFDFQVRQGSMWIDDPASYYRWNFYRYADGTLDSLHLFKQEQELGQSPYTNGHLQGYQAEVSGGSNLIRYYASAALDNDQGFIEVNNEKKWSARANLTVVPSERLSINTSLGLVTSSLGTLATGGTDNTIGGGLHRGKPELKATSSRGWPTLTAREQFDFLQDHLDADKFTASVQLTAKLLSWLEQRLTFGADLSSTERSELTPIPNNPDLAARLSTSRRAGFASKDIDQERNYTFDYGATGIAALSEALTSRTSAGLQYYARSSESIEASGEGFPAPGLSTVGSTSVNRTGTASFTEVASVGMFVQEEVQWNNRLFVTAAVRADDNSAFGEDFSIVIYPKLSASWVLSEEPFFRVAAIDQLRLRAAYGESGRQPAVNSALRTYSPTTGRGDAPVVRANSIGNPDLKPERGREIEVGFETSLWQNKLGFDVTAYRGTIDDVIVQRINASSSGFPGTQRVNAGRVDSKGFEALVTAQVGSRLDLIVSTSYVDNKVADLGGLAPIVINAHASGPMHVPGYAPASQFVRYVVSADFDKDFHAINLMCDGGAGPVQADGQRYARGGAPVPCAQAPLVYAGTVTPPWEGSFGGTWRPPLLENLSLVTSFGWTKGSSKFNQNSWAAATSYRVGAEMIVRDRYSPEVVANAENGASLATNNYYVEDNSYLRLRELSLNYTLPENFLYTGASRGSVSVGMRNVKTWTPYTGGDPEGLNSGLNGGSGFTTGRIDDTGGIPTPMSLTVTLRLGY
jgi:TonB-linked SusC/RagA family outer membrane protein